MDYTELADLGARLLAMFHTGLIRFNCSTCTLQEELNCSLNIDNEEPVFHREEVGDLYACPIKMIPVWCLEWYDEYLYNTTYNTAPPYGEKLKLQWEFERAYKRYFEEYKIKATNKSGNDIEYDSAKKRKALNAYRDVAKRNKR